MMLRRTAFNVSPDGTSSNSPPCSGVGSSCTRREVFNPTVRITGSWQCPQAVCNAVTVGAVIVLTTFTGLSACRQVDNGALFFPV